MKPATVNMHVAAVKSFLGFAHRAGFTRFNAAPLIKLEKALRQVAQALGQGPRSLMHDGAITRSFHAAPIP